MPKKPPKSEVVIEEEVPATGTPTSKAPATNWKQLLIVAGASIFGLWILLGSENGESEEKPGETRNETPKGGNATSGASAFIQSFPRGTL
jgi:hypothetical protein